MGIFEETRKPLIDIQNKHQHYFRDINKNIFECIKIYHDPLPVRIEIKVVLSQEVYQDIAQLFWIIE